MTAPPDQAVVFDCAGEALVGVLSPPHPAHCSDLGIVVVVGGPQYRIGSHRQFVLLARTFANAGHAVLRFDYRSMGDSSGERRDFLSVQDDIGAAIDTLQRNCPTVRRVVLWGLCDGASAALLYASATADRRLAGLCLLNPWVRSAASLARTQIRHYYLHRLLQPEFWRKLLRGNVGSAALRDLAGNIKTVRTASKSHAYEAASYQDRMARAWQEFGGGILLVLSGNDYTAKEFIDHVRSQPTWTGALSRAALEHHALEGADHTFSNAKDRSTVAQATLAWISRLAPSVP